jgi:hypothetical protein
LTTGGRAGKDWEIMRAMTNSGRLSRFLARLGAVVAAARFDHRIRAAGKRERRFLLEAGVALAGSASHVVTGDAEVQGLKRKIDDMEITGAELRAEMDASLQKDRKDWARATQLMRWVVVGRGWLDRWIVRDRMKYHRREADARKRELGALAFDGHHPALLAVLPDTVRDGVTGARAEVAAAQAARAQRLAPWNGRPLPAWLAVAARETREFLKHFWEQLSRRLFLRVPAVAALVVGWWLANHYTDSTLERIQRSMGFGGRAHLSPETLAALKFWLPLLAAAFCTYVVSAIALRIQKKYGSTS